jgi:hypothetical protein
MPAPRLPPGEVRQDPGARVVLHPLLQKSQCSVHVPDLDAEDHRSEPVRIDVERIELGYDLPEDVLQVGIAVLPPVVGVKLDRPQVDDICHERRLSRAHELEIATVGQVEELLVVGTRARRTLEADPGKRRRGDHRQHEQQDRDDPHQLKSRRSKTAQATIKTTHE